MKTHRTFLLLIICFFTSYWTSCKKENPVKETTTNETTTSQPYILYPATGNFGANILDTANKDTLIGDHDNNYSFAAHSYNGGEVVITIKNLSAPVGEHYPDWAFDISTEDDWIISDYDDASQIQTFELIPDKKGDLDMVFESWGGAGKAEIEIKELNTGEVVVIKPIYWE